mmetsp:Transcript_26347/g.47280  ORF Transcript_26347/g.47280 Transcript_26347/m.47280 type:complete len:126 (+) Transcript_26347:4127-4504(+)
MLNSQERKQVSDFFFYYNQNHLNTASEDRMQLNEVLTRAVYLNFVYTGVVGSIAYKLILGEKLGIIGRGFGRAPKVLGTAYYCLYEMYSRFNKEYYSEETLAIALKYTKEVEAFKSHYTRIYGNK